MSFICPVVGKLPPQFSPHIRKRGGNNEVQEYSCWHRYCGDDRRWAFSCASVSSSQFGQRYEALDNFGLLSTSASQDSAAVAAETTASSAVTPDGLRVESVMGTIDISPVTALQGALSADQALAVFAGDDASYALTSQADGAQANAGYIVLHNENAPTEYRFDIMAKDQAAVLSMHDGRVLVSDQSGNAINVIGAAWAKDADGDKVATSYRIEGATLIQTVDPTETTVYPVVADPRVQCDLVWCTIEFTRTETLTASQTAVGAGAVLCAGVAALNPIVGFVCGAYGAAFWVAAVQANNTGECVGFRMLTVGGSAHPVILGCYA